MQKCRNFFEGELEQELKSENEKNSIDIRDIAKKIIMGLMIGAVTFVLGKNGTTFQP